MCHPMLPSSSRWSRSLGFVALKPKLIFATFARIKLLGGSWLLVSAITALAPVKLLSAASALFGLRGPLLTFALIYLSARLTFHLADEPAPLNVAALPSELAAYLSFILVRYHFL